LIFKPSVENNIKIENKSIIIGLTWTSLHWLRTYKRSSTVGGSKVYIPGPGEPG
jgi:hypothetical protein